MKLRVSNTSFCVLSASSVEFQSGAFLHFWFVSAGPFDAFVAFVALRASRVSRFLSDYKFDQICMYVKSFRIDEHPM